MTSVPAQLSTGRLGRDSMESDQLSTLDWAALTLALDEDREQFLWKVQRSKSLSHGRARDPQVTCQSSTTPAVFSPKRLQRLCSSQNRLPRPPFHRCCTVRTAG